MAVYDWRLIREGSATAGMEETEWEDVYLVQGYDEGTGGIAVHDLLADRPDLAVNNTHPSIPFARVDSFVPERLEDTDAWQVTVSWVIRIRGESEEERQERENFGISPLDYPVRISTSYETVEVPAFSWKEDHSGGAVPVVAGDATLNTAGGFISGLTEKITLWNYNFEKNIPVYPAWLLDGYGEAVNSDTVLINGIVIPAEHLLVSRLTISELQTDVVNDIEVSYYVLSGTVTYHPRTWLTRALNKGLMQRNGANELVPCVDADGVPVTEPVFLGPSGMQLDPALPVSQEDILIVEGWNYRKLPFTGILPLS